MTTHQDIATKNINHIKTTVLSTLELYDTRYLEMAKLLDRETQKKEELLTQKQELKKKVFEGFIYNKVMRRKTKALYKYLDNIKINKLSEQQAKDLLKDIRNHLTKIAYSYNKEVFY